MRKTFILRTDGEPQTLLVDGRAGSWRVSRGEETLDAHTVTLPDGRLSVLLADGRQICGRVLARPHGEVEVFSARGRCRFGLSDPLHDRVDHGTGLGGSTDAEEEIRALMPGRVIEVTVGPGDRVEVGALLLVIEAMKMQNEIRAERDGVVARLDVASGQAVESGSLMLTIRSGSD